MVQCRVHIFHALRPLFLSTARRQTKQQEKANPDTVTSTYSIDIIIEPEL